MELFALSLPDWCFRTLCKRGTSTSETRSRRNAGTSRPCFLLKGTFPFAVFAFLFLFSCLFLHVVSGNLAATLQSLATPS